ncbi:MAG: galactokinase, partial [Erysipelotrichaceae bacterium]
EMRTVAQHLGVDKLSHTTYDAFLAALPTLRNKCSDRALLRAFHLFHENKRVTEQVQALRENDFETFKQLILQSGHSSFEYLQNVFPSHDPSDQGVSLGLALSQHCLQGVGAWRVHGGGFAGTIQAFVPNDLVVQYNATMEQVFGEGCVYTLYVRPVGGVKVF